MNPAGTLERGMGSPDGATGTRATSGGVKSAGVGRRVDIVGKGCVGATLAAVRLRLREQFRLCASPLDKRLCQSQCLNGRWSQRENDFRWKRLIATPADDKSLLAHLFRCVRQNAIVQDGVLVRPDLVDGIRVDCGKTSTRGNGSSRSVTRMAGAHLSPRGSPDHTVHEVLVGSLHHRASPCQLAEPSKRASLSLRAAHLSPSPPLG